MHVREVLRGGGVAALIALAAVLPTAFAQSKFPERPVRLVVPFAPGGVNDIIGRRYAQEMTRVLGQTMIVENKGRRERRDRQLRGRARQARRPLAPHREHDDARLEPDLR